MRSSATDASAGGGTRQTTTRRARLRHDRARAGRMLRPRRRRDAEPDHEVEVQPDQREYCTGYQEHVDRVEPAQRVRGGLGPGPEELRGVRAEERRRPVEI